MRTVVFCTELLKSFLVEHKIATLPDLKEALGTNVDMTVFRKLRELTYRTSYSHRGKYYTLDEIACFNDRGLWFFRAAGFSVFGTLIRTAKAGIFHRGPKVVYTLLTISLVWAQFTY